MPVNVTYPGVYIEELTSGAATIAPVATNIAAFVGRAPIGPIDEPITIFNYGDYARSFGGLAFDYPMSYAVQDFFNNGGSQAVIVRLFEPKAGQGSGVAQLKFPVPPPPLPDGWLLFSPAKAGDTTLSVQAPAGSEGEPDVGMVLTIPNDPTQYLVTAFKPVDAKGNPANVTIVPGLRKDSPLLATCTPLTFAYGQDPTSWTILVQSQNTATFQSGSGIPELGDTFTVGADPTVYTIVSEPTVSGSSQSALQVKCAFTPKPATAFLSSSSVSFSTPAAFPMPLGWQIKRVTTGAAGKASTIGVINGTGAPMPGDTFTVGSSSTTYVVQQYRSAAVTKKDPEIDFVSLTGDPIDPGSFCFCCILNFSRPDPKGWAIKSGAKAGQTSFVVGNSAGAATGVIDIGDTFLVGTDPTVYTVRFYDPASNTIYFLPEAAKDFSSSDGLVFSPVLTLAAANPGEWGNRLQAIVDTNGITPATAKQFLQYDLEQEDLFNLTLTLYDERGKIALAERYLNVAVKSTGKSGAFPNRLDRVLSSQSNLAVVGDLSMLPPASGATAKGVNGNRGDFLSPMTYIGDPARKTGMYLLEKTQIFNLLCIPPDRRIFDDVPEGIQDLDPAVRNEAAAYCTQRRAIYIVDPPVAWKDKAEKGEIADIDPNSLEITGTVNGTEVERNCAVYFPRVWREDLLMKSQLAVFAPSGMIAGAIAANDVARGVWKAPAGLSAGLAGVVKFEVSLTNDENGQLNPLGINCLRDFPVIGPVVWGSRTLRGADQFEDDYKYLPVRRLTLFIEESLLRGTQWAVFEPNDEALWSSLRLSVNTFLADLARQGAFYGYKVTCDATTTTQDDIDRGIVNILVQIAPVKPAEFVVIQIQQVAGQSLS